MSSDSSAHRKGYHYGADDVLLVSVYTKSLSICLLQSTLDDSERSLVHLMYSLPGIMHEHADLLPLMKADITLIQDATFYPWNIANSIINFLPYPYGVELCGLPLESLVREPERCLLGRLGYIGPVRHTVHLEGERPYQFKLSLVLGLIITGVDKNAKPSFKKLYKEQRAAYDAAKAK